MTTRRLLLPRLSSEEFNSRVVAALVRQLRRVPDASLGALLGLLEMRGLSPEATGPALEQLVPVMLQQLR